MNSGEIGWESLLYTDTQDGCALKAALFTTYDQPDERLFAEHVLPLFLKLNRAPDGEGAERQYFLLELDRRLKQLHDKIVVVSSMVRDEPVNSEEHETGTYGWIWRSIRHLTVGRTGRAVQHAKLWMLYWGAAGENGDEYLEMVVSSANLTGSAFKGQIQAAWRMCIKLEPQGSRKRLDSWGILPDFLKKLAASTGEDEYLNTFKDVLARGDCPDGVTFVASVPGTHSRQVLRHTPWGAAGLRKITPPGRGTVSISILSPFVGSWTEKGLDRWCAMFEGSPERLKLVWLDKNHPWASRWLLPLPTVKTLSKTGSSLLHLLDDSNDDEDAALFHKEHRAADKRWSHAKVYSLNRGKSQRLIVTSANFSTAAWGNENSDGQLTIENFELGVCIQQTVWPLFDRLDEFEEQSDIATVSQMQRRSSALIMWAQAVWDGKNVKVACRCKANLKLYGNLKGDKKRVSINRWKISSDGLQRSTLVPWINAKRIPSIIQLTCEDETVHVPVFDGRPMRDREGTIPPEVDENILKTMRDALLFEQYGGRLAADEDSEPDNASSNTLVPESATDGDDDDSEKGEGMYSDSYAVPAFELARERLRIVDNWANRVHLVAKRATSAFERQLLKRDGELLIEAFERQAERDRKRDKKKGHELAIGARLAAEELKLQLKHFPEE